LKRSLIIAENNGDKTPDVNLNLPPGYLEVFTLFLRFFSYFVLEIQRSKQKKIQKEKR